MCGGGSLSDLNRTCIPWKAHIVSISNLLASCSCSTGWFKEQTQV